MIELEPARPDVKRSTPARLLLAAAVRSTPPPKEVSDTQSRAIVYVKDGTRRSVNARRDVGHVRGARINCRQCRDEEEERTHVDREGEFLDLKIALTQAG